MVRVEQVLDSWKSIRNDTAAAVEDFPPGELDFRPAPDMDSFGQVAVHVLNAGIGLTEMLLSGEDDFTAPGFRDRMRAHFPGMSLDAGSTELARALRESIERQTAKLAAQPAEFYAHMITRFDGQRVTRLEMLQFVKEHELTHRSQLFVCLRMKGIVPATTRRRLAAQAGK